MSQSAKFYEEYLKQKENRRHNFIPTLQQYVQILNFLEKGEVDPAISKTTLGNWKARYKIRINEDNLPILMKRNKVVAFEEQLFDVLHRIHVELTGHGGRDAMNKHLTKYHGIGQNMIKIYSDTCAHCKIKKAQKKKGIVVKPILKMEKNYAKRYQVSLIDMQAQKDGEFNWILVVQDHCTKFVHLRPMRSKDGQPIAAEIKAIFCQFGPCKVMHTGKGREFNNQWLQGLCAEWGVKLVHGLPRKSSTQGSVEKANQDIENIIMTWQSEHKSPRWADHLPLFQLMKNNRFHKSLGKSPYQAVFGRPPHSLPSTMPMEWLEEKANEDGEELEEDEQEIDNEEDEFEKAIGEQQQFLTESGIEMAEVQVIVEQPGKGVLQKKFVRTFAVTDSDHLHIEDVPSSSTALRIASSASPQHGDQGFRHCTCRSSCESMKCSCRRDGKMCNSKCHNSLFSLLCTNKWA